MTLPIFFSDLDRTMIYSQSQIILHGQKIAGNLCVEQLHDKALSFISVFTWKTLQTHAGETFEFIPITTRTPAQFKRITLPGVKINHAVVLNGAKIFSHGQEDLQWTEKVKDAMAGLPYSPAKLYEKLVKDLSHLPEIKDIGNAGSFVYLVAHSAKQMGYLTEYMNALAVEAGYQISKQGRKIYLLPPDLTKGNAVKELKERLGSELTFAAGDTLLDYSMHPETEMFLRPSHGDPFAELNNHFTTTQAGIHASEDIVTRVLHLINAK